MHLGRQPDPYRLALRILTLWGSWGSGQPLWGFSEEVGPPPPTGAQSQEGMSGGTTRLVQRLLYPGAPWGLPGEGRGPTSQEDSRRCRWLSCL